MALFGSGAFSEFPFAGRSTPAAPSGFLAAFARNSNVLIGRAMKKNVSGQIIGVQMVSATDGSAFTGTVSALVTKDGATQTAGGGAVTHEGNGFHSYTITQSETDADHVAVTFTGTGAVPATVQVYTSFPQTGDNFARLGSPVGASISADIAAVKTQTAAIEVDTQDLQTRLPAALVSGRMDASVGAIASGVDLTATMKASVNTEVDTALSDVGLTSTITGRIDVAVSTRSSQTTVDTLTAYVDTEVAAIKAKTDNLPASPAAVSDIPSAASIADAVWDEALSGHVSAGTTGKALDDVLADTAVIGAPVGASISADIAAVKTQTGAIETDTQDIQSRLPAALVSGRMDASVGAMAANTLTASALATDAVSEIQSGLSTLDAAGVRSAIGLASANLDTQLDALPTAGEVADAVWDEALSGHTTAGSAGKALSDAGSAGDPWSTAVPGAYSAGTAGKILGDYLNAAVSSRATQTSVDTLAGYVDTEIGAIKAKTDLIPASPAAVSDIPTASTIADAVWDEATSGHTTAGTYGGRIIRSGNSNVEVLVTGSNHVAADVHEFQADALTSDAIATGAITADAVAADVSTEIAAGVWNASISSHTNAGSTGLALRDADLRGSRTVVRGTVGSSTTPSTTQFTPSSISPAGAAADQFKGRIIIFDNDTSTAALRGQATDITANSNASTPLLTFTALTTAPTSGDTFSIV